MFRTGLRYGSFHAWGPADSPRSQDGYARIGQDLHLSTVKYLAFILLFIPSLAFAQNSGGSAAGVGDCIGQGKVVGRINANSPPTCVSGTGTNTVTTNGPLTGDGSPGSPVTLPSSANVTLGTLTTTGATTAAGLTSTGPTSITGNQTNGSDQISKLCVNGVCPITAFGAVGDCSRTGSTGACTDNTTPILAACAQAKTKAQTVFFPSANSTTQTVYYALGPLPGCVGVNLQFPPQPQLANGDGSQLKVILRGGAGKDIFAPGDPTVGGYVKPSPSFTWTNVALEVDSTTDVSATFPHRKPGRTVIDATIANSGTTITSPTALFETGDTSPIPQAIEIVGAGSSACDAAIGGSNCLITTLTAIGTLATNARHSNTATVAAAASTAACASGGCTAYISMGSLPVTATIGNCGLAYDQTNGTSASGRASGARFDNTSIFTTTSGNNTCGMFFQGSQDPYGVHWIDLSIKGPTFDIAGVCSDTNPASGNCGWSDFNVIDHAQFGEAAPYPFTVYMGNWDRITNFQIGGDEHGIQLIEATNAVGETINNWTIDQVEDECNSECGSTVSGWRIAGLDNHISNSTLETKSGPAAIWDASDSTCVSCQTGAGGILQIGNDRNQIALSNWNSTTVTGVEKGNAISGARSSNALNGVSPPRPQFQFGSTNSRSSYAFAKTAHFLMTHDPDFSYNNMDDMWIWPPDAYASGGTNPTVVADATSETGAYLISANGAGVAITGIDGTPIVIGTHFPATRARVYIKLRAATGTPSQSIHIKGNGSDVGFIAPTLSTSYSVVSADVDYTGLTGDSASFNFNNTGTTDVYIAWIAVIPEPEYLNVNGSVILRGKTSQTGFVFANIGTALTTNGDSEYCADCTIANPCAGSGTGAMAKRLNGVNVCN